MSAAIRMTWDCSTVQVPDIRQAVRIARALELASFDIEEWDEHASMPGWTHRDTWATDGDGRFVSIPGE